LGIDSGGGTDSGGGMQVMAPTTIKVQELAVVIKILPDHGDEVLVEDWFWTVVMEVMAKVVVIQLLLGRGDGVRYSFGSSDITQQGDGGSGTGGGKQRICHL